MITANQGAKLTAATRLHDAREILRDIPTLTCVNDDQRARINKLISEIDILFGEYISNTK
jgi:hypothetical protein